MSKEIEKPKPAEEPERGPMQLVTRLVPMEEQVGRHVIMSLQQPNTVAVITTVAPGEGGAQNIVSVGLNEDLLDQVQDLLAESSAEELPRVPCVGFHCFLPQKPDNDKGNKK